MIDPAPAITPRRVAAALLALVVAIAWSIPTPVSAQLVRTPPERPDVMPSQKGESSVAWVDPKLGAQVPLDLPFIDERGERVTLERFFAAGKPVILTLNYYRCPALCGMMLNGLADALRDMNLKPGQDYQVVTISFDPAETPGLARLKKNSYLDYLSGMEGVESGWHFLTGEAEPIAAVADAVGYHYAWVPGGQQWSHPNAIMLLDGEGKVFRYLYPASQYSEPGPIGTGGGFRYHAPTLRHSLVETSAGEIGTIIDQIVLTCFAFDPHTGKYSQLAMSVMKAGGALTALLLTGIVVGFLVWERKRDTRLASDATTDAAPPEGRGG